jgi:hypothetical protein
MDDDDQFEQVVNSQYGQMESVMGQDGYKAFVEARTAEGAGIKAYADRNAAIAQFIRITGLIVFIMAIPVVVWLWKWALA